jgi:hypothetical protein
VYMQHPLYPLVSFSFPLSLPGVVLLGSPPSTFMFHHHHHFRSRFHKWVKACNVWPFKFGWSHLAWWPINTLDNLCAMLKTWYLKPHKACSCWFNQCAKCIMLNI